jgi:putative oxidoreductase
MIDWQNIRSTWSPRILSVVRIVVSFLFLVHGSQKLFGIPSSGQPFHSLDPFSLIWFAGVFEFFGGVLLFLGIFTRPVAFLLSGEMAVAYFKAHASYGILPLLNHGEMAVLYCFVFLYLMVAGGGAWSLDRLRQNWSHKADGPSHIV